MKLSARYLRRYKDIGFLLLKYAKPATENSRFHEEAEFSSNGHDAADQSRAKDLPNDLEKLGPTFIKLGQLLSGRPDLLPQPYLAELSRLQDNVKPVPFEEIQETVESELGARITNLFTEFQREPLAAASLGQVHRAALHDGRPVVVKVQRQRIARQIEDDFAVLEAIAEFLHRHTSWGERYDFVRILDEFENTLAHELDYSREAANMVVLGKNLQEFHRIVIPKPVHDYTRGKVLTMEFIEGVKVTQLSPLARLDLDGGVLAEELFRAYLKQILVDGVFHADPHPGNILLTPDKKIALLDVGMVGRTSPGLQEDLLKLLLAVSEGESEQAADIAIRIGKPAARFDEFGFRRKIGQIVADQRNATLAQMDTGKVILNIGKSAGDTGLSVPTEITVLGKALLQLDVVGRTLDPQFDPNESVRRNARDILNQRLKTSFSEGKFYSALLEGRQFLGALPTRLNKILDAVGHAELNVNVRPTETEFLINSAHRVANRITTGLILASLIIGAALLMRVQTAFTIFGYPGLAMACFLAAAMGGFLLVLNIFWQDHRAKHKARRR